MRNTIRKPRFYILLILTFILFVTNGISPVSALSGVYDERYYSENNILYYNPDDGVCSKSTNAVTSLSGKDNRQKIWNYLLGQGLTADQAAGVMGNLQSESGGTWSPTVNEFSQSFGEGGYGIAQWTHDPGRRGNLLTYMRSKNPDLMTSYYTEEYSTAGKSYSGESDGFIPKSATSGQKIPVADNDKLLLSQLDFLHEETTSRVITKKTADAVPSVTVGDSEFEALKKTTSAKEASDLWVYNFEIPANIAETAIARAKNADAILTLYSSDTSSGCISGGLRQRIVQVAREELELWQSGSLKPGHDYYKYSYNISMDWCAAFVSWVLNKAGSPLPPPSNRPTLHMWSGVDQFKNKGPVEMKYVIHTKGDGYKPQEGDFVFYNGTSHINIVEGYDEQGRMLTIGGNQGGVKPITDNYRNTSRVSRHTGYGTGVEASYYVQIQ